MLKAPKPDKTFHDKYFKGLNEAWIDSDGGEIIKHYWGGTAYINTVLPTSKELSSETICKYTYSFGSTPTITFGPDSVVAASTFTLKRVSLNNIQTQLFCTDSWVVKNGKLLTYSSGSRPMLLLNQNGGDLEVGEQVKIDCSNTDLIDETQTTGFTWEYTDNVYTLTKTYEGR